jgi:hypothetical protein
MDRSRRIKAEPGRARVSTGAGASQPIPSVTRSSAYQGTAGARGDDRPRLPTIVPLRYRRGGFEPAM